MKTIILPGYSPSNRQWAQKVKAHLESEDLAVYAHDWEHWETEKEMSIVNESKKILAVIDDEQVNIVAKSVGTRVACILLAEIGDYVEKLILCGIPTKGEAKVAQNNYAPLAHFSAQKVLVLQNERDPFASYDQAAKFIKSINPEVEIVSMPRSDHSYPYFREFVDFLKS